MIEEQSVKLLWRGRETVQQIALLIKSPSTLEIQLPLEYHHTLFRILSPDAKPGGLEEIDRVGSSEFSLKLTQSMD